MEFVNVGVQGSRQALGTTTGPDGRYSLNIPWGDTLRLRFSFTGFEMREIALTDSAEQHIDVMLTPTATNLSEVTVTDDRSRTSSFTKIETERLEHIAGPGGGVEGLIKTLPDVSSSNEMTSQYSVRGGSFDENLIYINGVEIYRPMLVRNGQQEGMSIINPDMVHHLLFSPGGFEATYGDKMSSVLDITYSRPTKFAASLSGSFLGGSAHAEGLIGQRLTYSVGVRYHTNQYLFSKLDTKGTYHTNYADLQAILTYRPTERLSLSLLALWAHNRYGLIPESQTTTFGSFMQTLELDVYFDGQERDNYTTGLAALTLDYHPTEDFQLRWTTSVQSNAEQESYDIQSQYWLYELSIGSGSSPEKFDRGVGTFLEHARNNLSTTILNTEVRATHLRPLGTLTYGIKAQYENINDRMREWKWVDSAGYAMPMPHPVPWIEDTLPYSPILQHFATAHNQVGNMRLAAYAQRELDFVTRHDHELILLAGVRTQYYTSTFNMASTVLHPQEEDLAPRRHFLFSPRISLTYKPQWKQDILFRLALGVYQQPPFYREYRSANGVLNPDLQAQTSYQAMGTFDWNFNAGSKPFKFTADVYYKHLTHLIPYTVDNLRIVYDPRSSAIGYVAGLSLRLNGELVPGLESWASLSLMQTQQDIEGDGKGWIARPTDQRISFKIFLQDEVPFIPWWRMSLNLLVGSGTPVTTPMSDDPSKYFRLPTYFRVDWGNTVQLSRFEAIRRAPVLRAFSDILVTLEVFNLFNRRNVASYIWVSDYDNAYYPVPNYLTSRQINLKLTLKL